MLNSPAGTPPQRLRPLHCRTCSCPLAHAGLLCSALTGAQHLYISVSPGSSSLQTRVSSPCLVQTFLIYSNVFFVVCSYTTVYCTCVAFYDLLSYGSDNECRCANVCHMDEDVGVAQWSHCVLMLWCSDFLGFHVLEIWLLSFLNDQQLRFVSFRQIIFQHTMPVQTLLVQNCICMHLHISHACCCDLFPDPLLLLLLLLQERKK